MSRSHDIITTDNPIVNKEKCIFKALAIDPSLAVLRLAEVVSISINSYEAVIKLIDERLESYENPIVWPEVTAEILLGSDDLSSTYMVSAVGFGKGDKVSVIEYGTNYFIVNPLDIYTYINMPGYALIHDFALLDIMNNLCINFYYEQDVVSYADFYNFDNDKIYRITGSPHPDKQRFLDRILYWRSRNCQNEISFAQVDSGTYPFERVGGGPSPAPIQKIYNTVRYANFINGVQYLYQYPFTDTDYKNTLSMFDTSKEKIWEMLVHPLVDDTLKIKYDNYTVVWFNDEDPQYALIIVCFPGWDSSNNFCQYIRFIEIPVYGFSERKLGNQDDTKPVGFQRYQDQVRVLTTIQRTWVDWATLDNDAMYSEKSQRSVSVLTTAPDKFLHSLTFGCLDGHAYTQAGSVFECWKIQKLEGTITRNEVSEEQHANGSKFEYTINITTNTSVSNQYSADVQYYDDDAGGEWESQVATTATKNTAYPMATDGENELTKKVDFDYYADGKYGDLSGGYAWTDYGGDFISTGFTSIINKFWEYIYLNSNLRFTNYFELILDTGLFSSKTEYNYIHFMDMELDLFVVEEIRQNIYNSLGPGASCDGTLQKNLVVYFEGTRYVIWEHSKTMTQFPTIWNFWPWMLDGNWPEYADFGDPPYNYSDTVNSIWWFQPFGEYYYDPTSEFEIRSVGYPCPGGSDITSTVFPSIRQSADQTEKSDYLMVDIDRDTNSWVVKAKCWFPTSGYTLTWPNDGDTVWCKKGQTPTFELPTEIFKITEYDPSKMKEYSEDN